MDSCKTKTTQMNSMIASFALLLMFSLIGYGIVYHSKPVILLDSILIPKKEGVVFKLGARELGQTPGATSADRHHLALKYQNNVWQMANISSARKIDVKTDARDTLFLKRLALKPNDQIQLGPNLIEVVSVSKESLLIENKLTGHRALWQDGVLTLKDQDLYSAGWWTAFKKKQQWVFRNLGKELFLFSLGGIINLHDQWAFENVHRRGAWISWDRGEFFLAPGAEKKVYLARKKTPETILTFHDQWLPLESSHGRIVRIVVGKTYYHINQTDQGLKLTPTAKIDILEASAQESTSVSSDLMISYAKRSWIGSGKSISEWIGKSPIKIVTGIVIGLFPAIFIWHFTSYYRVRVRGSIYFSSLLLSGFFLIRSAETAIDISWVLGLCGLAWIWATWSLFINDKLDETSSWLWSCAVFLTATGIIVLLQLCAGADNTRWSIYIWKQCFYIGLGGLGIGVIGYMPGSLRKRIISFLGGNFHYPRTMALINVLMYAGLTALLFVMSIRGEEQGMGIFQPSELMKLVLVLLAASTATEIWNLRNNPIRSGTNQFRQKFLVLFDIGLVLLMMVFAAIVSFLWIKDISPVLIITVFLLYWLWQITRLEKKHRNNGIITGDRLIKIIILVIILVIFTIACLIHEKPEEWTSLHQHDRFATWSDPLKHPFSGAQLLKSMRLVGLGGLYGADDTWFGKNENGNNLAAVMDDFTLSFLLYKFGGLAGIFFLFVQIGYLYLLFYIAHRLKKNIGYYEKRRTVILIKFAIQGLAVIHCQQWILSWSNSLNLLPVMGQPSTLLSSGNSHLLSIGFTTLFLGIFGGWLVEPSKIEA